MTERDVEMINRNFIYISKELKKNKQLLNKVIEAGVKTANSHNKLARYVGIGCFATLFLGYALQKQIKLLEQKQKILEEEIRKCKEEKHLNVLNGNKA